MAWQIQACQKKRTVLFIKQLLQLRRKAANVALTECLVTVSGTNADDEDYQHWHIAPEGEL